MKSKVRKCVVRGCKNRFIRFPGIKKYCEKCAKREQLKRQSKWCNKPENINRIREQKRLCQRRRRKNFKIAKKIRQDWKKHYKKNRAKIIKTKRKRYWGTSIRKRQLAYQYKRSAMAKQMVMAHYGKQGKPMCCWKNCRVADLDCLSLDHINDDGHEEKYRGVVFFIKLIKRGYPKGLQTLCWNHQWKKEIFRRKKNRGKTWI